MILLLFKIQWNLYKCSDKSNWFHLKMKNDEETAAAIVALLLVKKNKEKGKRTLTREEN